MRFGKLKWVLGVAACLGLALAAGSASAGAQVPFKGNLDGSTVPRVDPDLERFEVSGQATQLGQFHAVIEADLDEINIIGVIDLGAGLFLATLPMTATLTAANGDEVNMDLFIVGVFSAVAENFPSFDVDATITGGTGRFAGATGSFTGTGGQTSVPGEDNDLISATFSGTISAVGGN